MGLGGLFAASAVAHAGLALWTDDENRKVALWTGALKSTIGTLYQVVHPIEIDEPESDCYGLDAQLARAAEVERKRHNWFPHASSVALNLAAFAYVAYKTDDYLLATSGALLGCGERGRLYRCQPVQCASGLVRSLSPEDAGICRGRTPTRARYPRISLSPGRSAIGAASAGTEG